MPGLYVKTAEAMCWLAPDTVTVITWKRSYPSGPVSLKMDGDRAVEIDPHKHPHLDQGYAMTSHSSRGQTAARVLIQVEPELGAKDLLNSRIAVSLSCMHGRASSQPHRHALELSTAEDCLE